MAADVTGANAAGIDAFVGMIQSKANEGISQGESFKQEVLNLGGQGLVGPADDANQKMALDVDTATNAAKEILSKVEGLATSASSDLFSIAQRAAAQMGG
jgi:hypothetical protein